MYAHRLELKIEIILKIINVSKLDLNSQQFHRDYSLVWIQVRDYSDGVLQLKTRTFICQDIVLVRNMFSLKIYFMSKM